MICIMKKEDVDKFRKELNDDIDNIIEDDESEKEGTFFKLSHLFLTISIVCLIFVFGYLKGLCVFGLLLDVFGSLQMKLKYLRNRKKEDTEEVLTEDEFEEAFK